MEFLFWGNAPAALKSLRQIKTVADFKPNYKDYAAFLKTLPVDLALVPLEMVPFNQAKSPIKWLEYSACKIPGIFTNIEAYNQVVDHGKTGWLVSNTTEAWFNALEKLILDDGLRQSIAENAHKTVLARHLLKQNTRLWTQAYERALALPVKKNSNQAAQASIIIPTFNNLNLTRQCLNSILGNTPQGLYEIIVVDNGSTDGTPAFLKQEAAEGRIRAVFIHQNRGFAYGCNQGALAAKCPRLLFLNNDTVTTSGWLTAMLSALNQPNIGIVGAKLLYANNTIQHAGIGWINGIPDHPHRHAAANTPEASQFRELDMVTGACLMIPRELFLQLAGFDEIYQNGVEDVDLCLRARAAGYKVIYEPKAVVYHLEGQSVGRFSHVNENLKLFFNRWQSSFDQHQHFIVPNPPKIIAASRSRLLQSPPPDAPPATIDWIGSFLDHGSLSHVNRELTGVLQAFSDFQVSRISNGAPSVPGFEVQARDIHATVSANAAVTVRHAWPPNWQRPAQGKLVVIQPWEFGSLPADWVRQSASVDEFWVPSEYVRQVYVESGVPAKKVSVVPNGIDPDKFNLQATPLKLVTQKQFKFLFVGGTIGRKGPDLLLEAYLKNFTAADDVCLVIKDFGGKSFYAGQTFESQIRAAQALPDAPEILYLNTELPPESLPGIYTACDCLVLPYRG
ncbi:MAG TPA: glycosyltransferase, partial [Candidatus Saccharimonadales bacterium]|nr:glycosyltransferase [Candidatus Saccharimonadales bacterium]